MLGDMEPFGLLKPLPATEHPKLVAPPVATALATLPAASMVLLHNLTILAKSDFASYALRMMREKGYL